MEYFDNTDLRVFYFTPFRNNKNRFFYFVYTIYDENSGAVVHVES